MKARYLLILFCLVCAACSETDAGVMMIGGGAPAAAPPPALLLLETFEGTGYSSPTWDEAVTGTGSVDEDTAVGSTGMEGSQVLALITPATSTAKTTRTLASNYSELWFKFMFRLSASEPYTDLIKIFNSADVVVGGVYVNGSCTRLVYYHGDDQSECTGADIFTFNQLFYLWGHWKQGGSGEVDFYLSTTSTKPSVDCTVTNGTSTDTANKISLQNTIAGGTIYWDHVWVDNASTNWATW